MKRITEPRARGMALRELGTALLAIALLGVPALLAGPWPSLGHPFDPEPWASLTGHAALTTVLATVALALRPSRVALGAALVTLPAVAFLLGLVLGDGTEPFETSRVLTVASAGLAAFALAATADRRERRVLAFGLCGVTVALGLPLIRAGGDVVTLAGVLQNTGYANQVLLPGAAAGLLLTVTGGLPQRLLGIAAVVVGLAHAALSPTLLGLVTIGMVALALALSAGGERRRLAILGVLALALIQVQTLSDDPDPATPAATEERVAAGGGGNLGGVGVRRAVWAASLQLVDPTGVGPGRFRATFPAVRDLDEIRASEAGGNPGRTEVEHPHNDWLLPWVELGLLGGLLWTAFLGAGALAALRALRSDQVETVALGAAGLAALANAAGHGSLLVNPVSAILGLGALGACVGTWAPVTRGLPTAARRGAGLAPLVVLLLAPLTPWDLATTGAELGRHLALDAELRTMPATDVNELVRVGVERSAALERSLDASDRSNALALQLAVQDARRDNAPVSASELVDRLATLRPDAPSTLELAGLVAIDRGRLAEARDAFGLLHERRPDDADAAFNLVRLELQLAEGERALAVARDSAGRGAIDAERLTALARDAQLAGWTGPETVVTLLELAGADTDPEALFERAERLREQDTSPATRAAFESLAQHQYAREHAAGDDFPTAARVYRQALRATRVGDRDGSEVLRLETAAAERLAGNEDRALTLLEGRPDVAPRLMADLPAWVATALDVEPR